MVSSALSFSGASLHTTLLKSPTSKARSSVESHRHLSAKLRPTVDPSPAFVFRENTSLQSSTFLPAYQPNKKLVRDVKVPAFSAAGSDLDGEHLSNGGDADKPDRQTGRGREGGGEDRPSSKKGETAITLRSDGQTDPFTYGLRWIRISTAAGLWLALFFASCLNRDDSGGGGTPSANFPLPGRTRGGSGGGSRKFSSRSSSSSAFTDGSPDS